MLSTSPTNLIFIPLIHGWVTWYQSDTVLPQMPVMKISWIQTMRMLQTQRSQFLISISSSIVLGETPIKSIKQIMDEYSIKIGEITCFLTTFNSSGNPHLEGAGGSFIAQLLEEGASDFAVFETTNESKELATDLFKKVVLVPDRLVFYGIARSASGNRIDFDIAFDKIRALSEIKNGSKFTGSRFCVDSVTNESSPKKKDECIISAMPPQHCTLVFCPSGTATSSSSLRLVTQPLTHSPTLSTHDGQNQ